MFLLKKRPARTDIGVFRSGNMLTDDEEVTQHQDEVSDIINDLWEQFGAKVKQITSEVVSFEGYRENPPQLIVVTIVVFEYEPGWEDEIFVS